jgi:hypothetical protein
MPLEVLWSYREFKRDELPAPVIPFIHSHTVDEVIRHVRLNGMEPVELSVIKDRALLTDGNHRIIAAQRLGIEVIPVKILVLFGDGSDTFYKHTLDRFKPIMPELAHELKKVFLEAGWMDGNKKPVNIPPRTQS